MVRDVRRPVAVKQALRRGSRRESVIIHPEAAGLQIPADTCGLSLSAVSQRANIARRRIMEIQISGIVITFGHLLKCIQKLPRLFSCFARHGRIWYLWWTGPRRSDVHLLLIELPAHQHANCHHRIRPYGASARRMPSLARPQGYAIIIDSVILMDGPAIKSIQMLICERVSRYCWPRRAALAACFRHLPAAGAEHLRVGNGIGDRHCSNRSETWDRGQASAHLISPM